MKSILITDCSSGYGLATASHFLAHGWRVVATMRTPGAGLLPASPNLQVLALEVTDPTSIGAALAAARDLDVLVQYRSRG